MTSNPFKIENEFSGEGTLNGKYRTSWVEESFDIDQGGNAKMAVAHTHSYIGTSIESKRIKLFFLVIFVGLFFILCRSLQLQIFKGDYYRALAEGNRIRRIPIPSERGIIYDREGKRLVENIPGFSLALVPQDLPHVQNERLNVVNQVAYLSNVSSTDILDLLTKYGAYSYESLPLKDNIDYETALRLYIQNANLPGIEVESGSKRGYYIASSTSSTTNIVVPSLSHLLGYVGKLSVDDLKQHSDEGYLATDNIGKTGLEKQYESYLRGTYGRQKIEVNAIGKEQSVLAVQPPVPGKDLTLSLDLEGQKKLEALVKDTAQKTGTNRIAAIAMNPQNGESLAMISWPSFDNNKFVGGIDSKTFNGYINNPDHPLYNRVIGGLYPPGSTVKLIVSAAALQEKIITPFTTVNSVGGIQVGDRYFKDWKAGGHGITNVTKALAWSVNTFFYYVGGGFEKFIGGFAREAYPGRSDGPGLLSNARCRF